MEQKNNFGKVLLGTAVILIGSLLLMDNLDIVYFPWKEYLLSWKTLMIFAGLVLLAKHKNVVAGIILISLGAIFWLPEMLNDLVSVGQIFWPLVLVMVGLLVIFKTRNQRAKDYQSLADAPEGEVTIIEETEEK